ncbi:uncharacterized protein PAE49_016752 isoform 1-T3 [Odontesthes bonariensis]
MTRCGDGNIEWSWIPLPPLWVSGQFLFRLMTFNNIRIFTLTVTTASGQTRASGEKTAELQTESGAARDCTPTTTHRLRHQNCVDYRTMEGGSMRRVRDGCRRQGLCPGLTETASSVETRGGHAGG